MLREMKVSGIRGLTAIFSGGGSFEELQKRKGIDFPLHIGLHCALLSTKRAKTKRLKHHLHLAHYKKHSAVKYNIIFSLHRTHKWIQNVNSGISTE